MKVLGIDPGTRNLGWGLIEVRAGNKITCLDYGCLAVSGKTGFVERLSLLDKGLSLLVRQHKPHVAAIEKIFLGKNVDSAFKLGHIRGICAVQCQSVGAKVFEYTPRTVKKQITGSGSAEKQLVQNFVERHLSLSGKIESEDASDALALALCHILQSETQRVMQRARPQ